MPMPNAFGGGGIMLGGADQGNALNAAMLNQAFNNNSGLEAPFQGPNLSQGQQNQNQHNFLPGVQPGNVFGRADENREIPLPADFA